MMENGTADCTVVMGPKPLCEPRIRWNGGNGYALVEIGRHTLPIDLPGNRIIVGAKEVLGENDVLLLSERCGGSRDLLDWWCRCLNQDQRPWVLVHAGDWVADFFDWSEAPAESELKKAGAAIQEFGSAKGRAKRAQALIAWAKDLKEPFTMMIRDLMSLGSEEGFEAATALRSIRDHQLAPHLHVVLLSHSESAFEDKYHTSGYLSYLRQFRLPTLNGEEISLLAAGCENAEFPRLILEGAALDSFLDHTGGQPLLVQHFLRFLQHAAGKKIGWEVPVEEVIRAARHLRKSPPEQTQQWEEDLRRLLRQRPDLARTMETYVAGTSLGPPRFPPPREDRALFIAGWVGLNRMGRWGITSEFHAHLARPILDEFQRSGK